MIKESMFLGKLKEAPQMRSTHTGAPVVNFELVCAEVFNGKTVESIFRFAVFGDGAKRLMKQGVEGAEVWVTCEPENRSYTDKMGRIRRAEDHRVRVLRVCQPLLDGELQG